MTLASNLPSPNRRKGRRRCGARLGPTAIARSERSRARRVAASTVVMVVRALPRPSVYVGARIDSEDAAWTTPFDASYLECLPKTGLKVLDHIRFNPDTTDFTPIFHRIEDAHPDAIITGMSHVGVQPTVQWHDQQVPIPMLGISAQATTSAFWKDRERSSSRWPARTRPPRRYLPSSTSLSQRNSELPPSGRRRLV